MRARFHSEVNPAVKKLAKLMALNGSDMKSLSHSEDKIFAGLMLHAFRTEGSITGSKWKVKDEAKLHREKLAAGYPGRKIMQRTRALYRSLKNTKSPGHVREWSLARKTITLGTRQFIAAFHVNKGRDVMQHTAHQYNKYMREIVRYFEKVKTPRALNELARWQKRAVR